MTGFSQLALVGVLGLMLAAGSTWLVLRLFLTRKFSPRAPEAHHIHQVVIPRLGGIGLAVAFTAAAGLFLAGGGPENSRWEIKNLLATALAMFALGLWDDLRPLGARRKLAGQIIIASIAFFLGIGITKMTVPFSHDALDLGLWAWPVTVLWLVATTNLINLIDGVDGLAGGICLMLMILLVGVSGVAGGVAWIAAAMIGGLLGFLWFNFPPARIYLGDGGAYFMGFLIGGLTIISSQKGTILAALIAPLFVLALPILDTSVAILRRGLQGLPLFRPDRRHIHHRLLDSGISRRQLVLGAYIFTAFFLFLGFTVFWSEGEQMPILLGVGAFFILLAAGRLSFSREWFAVGHVLGNSLSMRAEIQYALAQKRWLILEGGRCSDLATLGEDTAFIARKIGFATVCIRLGDDEKNWRFTDAPDENGWRFRQNLPGRADCHIELTAHAPGPGTTCTTNLIQNENTFRILAELLAGGWAKAVARWELRHG
jgi:UDP-GlcNAc:undecaprenyl-phosphate GlcNAc-1-phosphate transferase